MKVYTTIKREETNEET